MAAAPAAHAHATIALRRNRDDHLQVITPARLGATAPPGLAELARLLSRTRAGPVSGYGRDRIQISGELIRRVIHVTRREMA
jgi:hypothetical protein